MALLVWSPDIGCSQWDFHWANGLTLIAHMMQIGTFLLFAQYLMLFVQLYFGFSYLQQQNKSLTGIFLISLILD